MKNFKQQYNLAKNQGGFAGTIFLVIALIGVVIAAIAAMSRGSVGGTSEQTAKTNAAVMMKHASDYKEAFDRVQVEQGVSAGTITFDQTATGIFNPAAGWQYAVLSTPPASSIASGTPEYTYNKLVQLPGVGTPGGAEYVVVAGNVTDTTCRMINRIIYNTAMTDAPPASAGSLSDWTTGASVDDSAAGAPYSGRAEGCVAASGGSGFVYYKAVAEF